MLKRVEEAIEYGKNPVLSVKSKEDITALFYFLLKNKIYMAHKNHMKVNGRGKADGTLTINLADDKLEVRGFGQPVTREAAKTMAKDYFDQCLAAWEIVKEINSNVAYDKLKAHSGFSSLESLINPDHQTVSGVFGKEIILQILSQKGCEGIRYVYGKDNGKNTIVLLAVAEKEPGDASRNTSAVSVPINFSAGDKGDENEMPVVGEVHDESLTIQEVKDMLGFKGLNNSTDILFGEY